MADYGNVVAVNTKTVGDQVAGAHAAGVTVLQLDEASEFPNAGTVSTDLGLLDFTKVDVDEDLMTLATSVPAGGLPDGSRVELWDSDSGRNGAVATEKIAYVRLEGSEDDGDLFEATIRHSVRSFLPDGIRTGPGEVVELDIAAEQVIDVPGRTPQLDGQAVWNPHSFRIKGGAFTLIPDAAHTQLTGWTDVETDGADFSSGSWTITTPAWYSISAWMTWAANVNGRRRLRIVINGVAVRINVQPADPEIETYNEASVEARLVEGDVVTAWVYQTSGAGLNVTDGAFSIHRLSI